MADKKGLYPSRIYEDILMCVAASYFTACFSYDFYISGRLFTVLRVISLCFMLLCWMGLSLMNGLRMRKSFIAAALLWNTGLPLMSFICKNIESVGFTKIGIFIRNMTSVLCEYPYYEVMRRFNISGYVISFVLSAVCLLLFAAGYIYTKKIILSDDIERI